MARQQKTAPAIVCGWCVSFGRMPNVLATGTEPPRKGLCGACRTDMDAMERRAAALDHVACDCGGVMVGTLVYRGRDKLALLAYACSGCERVEPLKEGGTP